MASKHSSFYKGSDEIPSNHCDACLSGNKPTEAISFCTVCGEYMCQPCDRTHGRLKTSRDHTVLRGDDMPTTKPAPILPFMYCDKHKTAVLDLYCTTHDEVLCTTCKLASHTTCDTRDVKSHSARVNVLPELNNVSKYLKDMTSRYGDLVKRRNLDKSALKTQVQTCLRDVKKMRKDINDLLDKLEKEMTAEIHKMEQTITNEIDRHVTLADDILRQLDSLVSSLAECQKTQRNDVIYVGLKKSSFRAREYEHIISGVHREITPSNMHFKPNEELSDLIQQLQSLGTVVNNTPDLTGHVNMSVLNMTVTDKREIDVNSKSFAGSVFMSDGHLLLACLEDGLKLFDTDFKLKSQLPQPCFDVATINDTDVVVTTGDLKRLHHVRVLPNMAVTNTITTDRNCYDVDVNGDEIFVNCHDAPGRGEVRVMNMRGHVKRRLGVDGDQYMFTSPRRVKVNRDGSKVFVSDWKTDSVTCLDRQGHVIYKYSGGDLKNPVGIYVDGGDNLLVCGIGSDNVHVVRCDRTRERILLSEKDGIQYPYLISYRPSDGSLVVVLHPECKRDKLFIVYKTK